jgi:hypothetical protein
MSETANPSANLCREAVGVFHHWTNLQAAVDELLNHGFDRAEISMLAGEEVVERKLGHVYEKVSELEDDPNAPRIAFVGRDSLTEGKASAIGTLGYVGAVAAVGAVVASGGALAWVLLAGAAAGGGGAALGSLLAKALGRGRAKDIEAQIDKGGLLLWVRTCSQDREARAMEILKEHGADDVHVHEFEGARGPEFNPLGGLQPDPFLPQARV